MKVVFLDFDGVMNNHKFIVHAQNCDTYLSSFDPKNVKALQRILDAHPDLKIVISSSWRIYFKLPQLRLLFKNNGLDPHRIIDRTGHDRIKGRGDEIDQWLKDHPKVTSFAIIDDDAFDMDPHKRSLVQTSMLTGLTDQHANEVIKMLGS